MDFQTESDEDLFPEAPPVPLSNYLELPPPLPRRIENTEDTVDQPMSEDEGAGSGSDINPLLIPHVSIV